VNSIYAASGVILTRYRITCSSQTQFTNSKPKSMSSFRKKWLNLRM